MVWICLIRIMISKISLIDDHQIKEEYFQITRHFKTHFNTITQSRYKQAVFQSPSKTPIARSDTYSTFDEIPNEASYNLDRIIPLY